MEILFLAIGNDLLIFKGTLYAYYYSYHFNTKADISKEDNLLTVVMLCNIAGVSKSGYYNWVASEEKRLEKQIIGLGKESNKEKALTILNEMIDFLWQISDGIFNVMFAEKEHKKARELSKLARKVKSEILAKGE